MTNYHGGREVLSDALKGWKCVTFRPLRCVKVGNV